MWPRLIVGIVLGVVGVVWIGQGVGAIGGSFMTGQAGWAVIGAVALALGIVLVVGASRTRRGRADGP